jgi:hypothetical protein
MKKLFKSIGFTVLITAIMLNAMLITGCNGDPSPDDPPPPPSPTATFAEIEFFPSSWGEEGDFSAEQWETNNQIKLSAFFSSKKPKQGDVLSFKISGVSDKELKYIRIELGECVAGDWSTYNYLGSSWRGKDDGDLVNLSTSFSNKLINVPISNPTNPNAAIYAQLVNLLWEKDPSGEYVFNSGETLPAGFQKGDVMATIRDFKISLVKIDSSNNIDNNYGWSVWRDNNSTATLDYSIANDGVCTVTIGGTPEKDGEDNLWNAWRISAERVYNVKADTQYKYTFEAWTESGTRRLQVQYYEDQAENLYPTEIINITTTRTTYTFIGQILPKSGHHYFRFKLADQLGTVNLKILEIKEINLGKLTITNFSSNSDLSQNNYLRGDVWNSDNILGFGAKMNLYEDSYYSTGIQIKGNTINIPVWEAVYSESYTFIPFLGNITIAAGNLVLQSYKILPDYSWDYLNYYVNKVPITFTNGNATIDFATQMELVDMSDEEDSIDPIEP